MTESHFNEIISELYICGFKAEVNTLLHWVWILIKGNSVGILGGCFSWKISSRAQQHWGSLITPVNIKKNLTLEHSSTFVTLELENSGILEIHQDNSWTNKTGGAPHKSSDNFPVFCSSVNKASYQPMKCSTQSYKHVLFFLLHVPVAGCKMAEGKERQHVSPCI